MPTLVKYIIGLVIVLIAAPEYVFGGLAVLAVLSALLYIYAIFGPLPSRGGDAVIDICWGFEALGYVWVIVKYFRKFQEHQNSKEWEKERLAKIEEESLKQARDLDEERTSTAKEYGEIANQAAHLLSSSAQPAKEMMAGTRALGVHTFDANMTPKELLLRDVAKMVAKISDANNGVPDGIARVRHAIVTQIAPDAQSSVKDCAEYIQRLVCQSLKVSVPVYVLLLTAYDKAQGTTLGADSANFFCKLLLLATNNCDKSVAVKLVESSYLEALRPYLPQKSVPPHTSTPVLEQRGSEMGLNAVAGMTSLKKQLRDEVVEVFRDPSKYQRYGISIPNGILLFGPPGCGKTYIARQLASELGYHFFEIVPSDVGSSYVHGTTLKIRETFEEAARKAPSVLFIDEFEALVPSRDSVGSGHQYKAEEVNEFLTQMGGCADRRVLLIAATNQPWEIDSAVQRAGRLDKKIYVAPPDLTARGEMLAHHLNGRYTAPDLNTEVMASQLSGYSSSDLKLLVEEAAKLAFKADVPIAGKHMITAKSIVPPSITSEEEARYQQFAARGAASLRAKVGFQN